MSELEDTRDWLEAAEKLADWWLGACQEQEERAKAAEAERDQLLEQQVALSARLKVSEAKIARLLLAQLSALRGADGRIVAVEAELVRLREALQRTLTYPIHAPDSFLNKMRALAATEEPNP